LTQRWVPWLAGLTVLGAALRFAFLDAKGFWEDEAVTLLLVRMDFGEMLSSLPDFERTPPLYYALAWAWAKLFGEGEVGMRSLSALLGTATIPVAFRAARELVTPRTALVAAALVAVNPILVWYSQEARSYALLVLLAALSLLYFARRG
jgi:mannosyltransferase